MIGQPPVLLGLSPGLFEIILIGAIAVMLFGKKLPDVARQFGKHYREFRKQISSIQAEFTSATSEARSVTRKAIRSVTSLDDADDANQPTAPKFEPPPEEPTKDT